MIGDEYSVLPVASPHHPHTLLSTDLVGNLSEDCVLPIMSTSVSVAVSDPSTLGVFNLLEDRKKSVLDIDLSFLNEGIDPSNENLNFQQEGNSAEDGEVVIIDVTRPIQLSQNSLIMVEGQKCVLQHDPQTGQVVAYPVKEQGRRRRGRPRRGLSVNNTSEKDSGALEKESDSEEEKEKGLQEVVNDDGSLVRRSSRKRKKAKALKDYETGNLQQELGSDAEDVEDLEHPIRRRRPKGPGRPRKSPGYVSASNTPKDAKKDGARTEEEEEANQAFLVQTGDGQTLVLQVPLSSIPEGTTLQEVAQQIANKLNAQSEMKPLPALQDHSIGSTTTHFSSVIGEEEEEISQREHPCNQSLGGVASGLVDTSESLEDPFCLDVSSTTTAVNGANMLCSFEDSLSDHNLYTAAKQQDPPEMDQLLDRTEAEAVDTKQLDSSSDRNKDDLFLDGGGETTLEDEGRAEDDHPEKPSPAVMSQMLPASGPKKCKICAVPYFTEEEIVQHFKARHPRCVCSECGYMNEHPYAVKRHSYRHSQGGDGCFCTICNKKYKDSYILKMHVKMVHLPPEVLFRCQACGKEFNRKAHLKRHQRTHDPLKQYQCPICEYQGCEKSDVTKHLLIHEEPKFKCELCGKAFRHFKNKELHVKRHSGQRDYKCAVCSFYGYTYTDIRKHIERRHFAKPAVPVELFCKNE